MMMFIVGSRKGDDVIRVPFSDLLPRAEEGRIAGIVVTDHTLEATLTDGQVILTTVPASHLTGSSSLLTELEQKRIRIEFRATSEQPAYSYGALFVGLAFVGLLTFTLYRVTS